MSVVYTELHAMAVRFMRSERKDHTLQPSALVNEAYMRLMGGANMAWQDRAHFFGTAAQVMRHVLTDYARHRLAGKRGAGAAALPIEEALIVSPDRLEEVLVLEDALTRLEKQDARSFQVVIYRIYGGLEIAEIAEIMQLSPRTVRRDWQFGQAWLKAELRPHKKDDPE